MDEALRRHAARLREIVVEHGWPDGTLAAWFIAQHAIGEPDLQRLALKLVQEKVKLEKVPAAQKAYLVDRVAMCEGRPQRYGT